MHQNHMQNVKEQNLQYNINTATTGDNMTSRLQYPYDDIRIISISQPKARKDYECIGCNSKINKGDRYQRNNFTDDNINMGQQLLSTTSCLSCSTPDHPVFGVTNGKYRKMADLTWRLKTQKQPIDWYSC